MDALISALQYLATGQYWLAVSVAVLLAAFASVVPGVSSILVMAVAIPIIIFNIEDPVIGLTLLATIGGVNNTLDSIPAVLMGIPSGPTQVTFLEGNQLAQRGQGAYVLGGVYAVSAVGGVVGAIALAIVIPIIKPFILSFSFPETAAMAIFGVGMVAALSRGAFLKGIAAGLLGILLSAVGVDAFTGEPRWIFNRLEIYDGLPLIATTIGLFAMPELIDLTMTRRPLAPPNARISFREVTRGARDGLRRWRVTIRQSLFGVFLGAVPGVGANVIDWLSYALGIFLHKGSRAEFGKGSFDGVLFAESAQNAKEGGQAIPTLALGIPGGLSWALVLGAMLLYGLAPGPAMLTRYADLTIILVLTLAIANLGMTLLGILFTGQLAKLALIPYPLLSAMIIPVSLLSALNDMNSWLAFPIVFSMAAIGLVMKRYQWPRPPLLLGFILGGIIEKNTGTAINVFGPVEMLTRPITITLLVLAVIVGFLFTYYLGRNQITNTEAMQVAGSPGDGPPPQGAADDGPSSPKGARSFHFLKGEVFGTLALMALVAYMVYDAADFPNRARAMPWLVGGAFLVISAIVLYKQVSVRQSTTADIMDIGMRSAGMAHARVTGWILVGLICLFFFVSMAVGVRWAAVTYAIAASLALGDPKWRVIGAVVSAVLVGAFSFGILDWLSNVIWPLPIFQVWLGIVD